MAFVTVKLLNVRMTFSEDLFERFRPTVPSPNPNDLGWKPKQQPSALSQRFVEEVSPRSGPNNVAHGDSRIGVNLSSEGSWQSPHSARQLVAHGASRGKKETEKIFLSPAKGRHQSVGAPATDPCSPDAAPDGAEEVGRGLS
jgi:hypothetical protein